MLTLNLFVPTLYACAEVKLKIDFFGTIICVHTFVVVVHGGTLASKKKVKKKKNEEKLCILHFNA